MQSLSVFFFVRAIPLQQGAQRGPLVRRRQRNVQGTPFQTQIPRSLTRTIASGKTTFLINGVSPVRILLAHAKLFPAPGRKKSPKALSPDRFFHLLAIANAAKDGADPSTFPRASSLSSIAGMTCNEQSPRKKKQPKYSTTAVFHLCHLGHYHISHPF